jgi:Calcineurin-like phosphoesterase
MHCLFAPAAAAAARRCALQSGDIFDRGEHDLAVEELLYSLTDGARAAGGAVHCILGNHEALNACGDHSMASRTAFQPFEDLRPEVRSQLQCNTQKYQGVWLQTKECGESLRSTLEQWCNCF